MFNEIFTPEGFSALLQVMAIDLVLAGDNAVVIGLAAAGLPRDQRNKAILVGILAATVLRIAFAGVATQLLQILGLLLVGGILLLVGVLEDVARTAPEPCPRRRGARSVDGSGSRRGRADRRGVPKKTFAQAAWQIVVADVSMSLDNVLAVAGAAREHPTVLVIGLGFSIALMGWPRASSPACCTASAGSPTSASPSSSTSRSR